MSESEATITVLICDWKRMEAELEVLDKACDALEHELKSAFKDLNEMRGSRDVLTKSILEALALFRPGSDVIERAAEWTAVRIILRDALSSVEDHK